QESSALISEYSEIFEILQAVPERRDLWNRIYQRLDEPSGATTPKVIVMHTPSGRALARRIGMAAAAAAALIFITWIFFFTNKKPTPVIALRPTHDVAPGRNRATLTLANGTVIALDSLRDGQLALQGNTKVVKLNNSQLYYKAENHTNGTDSAVLSYNTITTPKGGQYQVTLSDGSKVWLNSDSRLKFPTVFRGRERKVELSGEGYFEIEKNAGMPFSVLVNQMQVQVLGTQFDIMAYGDEKTVNTTLLQGAVKVEQGNLARQLVPGEQAVLDAPGNRMSILHPDVQKVIAWKNGIFEFQNTDLPAIMRQLSRWYDIDVHYKVEPGKPELGGSISKHLNLSQVLNMLEKNGINHFSIEGRNVTVLP
ncbi:MAG: FecR domain-containing protein, partial [Bacteroidota bacterium]|nr:FecR domain-containing protein [Bacteroidota bacterium]